jgi:hypothetical protein
MKGSITFPCKTKVEMSAWLGGIELPPTCPQHGKNCPPARAPEK